METHKWHKQFLGGQPVHWCLFGLLLQTSLTVRKFLKIQQKCKQAPRDERSSINQLQHRNSFKIPFFSQHTADPGVGVGGTLGVGGGASSVQRQEILDAGQMSHDAGK